MDYRTTRGTIDAVIQPGESLTIDELEQRLRSRDVKGVGDLGEMRAKKRRAAKAAEMVREAAAKLERQPSKLVGKPYVEVEVEPPQPIHSEAELDRAEQAALRDIAAKLRKVEAAADRMRSAIVAEKRRENLAALEQACNQAAAQLALEPSQLPRHELPYTEILSD